MVPATIAAEIASSELAPAGTSCRVTGSSGRSAFQASVTACPQASSCSLLETQMRMGPREVAACAASTGLRPQPAARTSGRVRAVAPNARRVRVIVELLVDGWEWSWPGA